MALTKSLRDAENERINNILKKLVGLDYVPESSDVDPHLGGLGLSAENLLQMTPEQAVAHVQALELDWTNAELFADFLADLGTQTKNTNTVKNAVAVYNYIQNESKMFSFGIFNKIALATSQL